MPEANGGDEMKQLNNIIVLKTGRSLNDSIVWSADLPIEYLEKYHEWLGRAIIWQKAYMKAKKI